MKRVVWFILFPLVVLSCLDQPDCKHTNNSLVGISFRTKFDGRADTVKIVRVTASGTTLIFDSLILASSISLPLNYLTDSSTFRIVTSDRTYVLNLGFKVKPQFVTADCPERFVLSNLSIRQKQGVDSIKLVTTTLSNPAQGNISIYRCPKNTILKLSFRQWYMDTLSRGKLDTRAITSITNDFTSTVYSNVSVNTVFLPLNISTGTTAFTFNFADNTKKKFYVKYDVAVRSLFSMCLDGKFPHKLSPTVQEFEILHIRRDSIYDPPKTNVEAFRCPITNLITATFKNATSLTISETLKSITADYLGTDTLYRNVIKSSVSLPLNPASDNTTFRFQFESKTGVVTLGYTRTDQTYHSECGIQKAFTLLEVLGSTGFSGDPKVTDKTVKFPTVTNLEIIQ